MHPFSGRLLDESDDREGAAPAAVLSYTVWQTKFGADPHLVGATILLGGQPVTVKGITAQKFLGERNETDPAGIWLPVMQEPGFDPDQKLIHLPGMHWLDLLTRIADKDRVPQVQVALNGELQRWLADHLDTTQNSTPDQRRKAFMELLSASGGINSLRQQYETDLHLLLLVAGFVLLIACANLANLMLVRGMARQGELALRSALGAPRGRLIRQTLVESLVLALVGGVMAVGVAFAGTHAILALAFKGVEVNPVAATPSWPVLGFALLLSLVTGLLFGMAPAWVGSRFSPVEALRGANRTTGDSSALPQRVLVILQSALSLALLSTAGLLITSLRQMEHQDFHFEPQGRLIVSTDLTAAGYKAAQLPGLYQQVDNTFARLPEVQHFAYATYGPMSGSNWSTGVWFPGGDVKGQLAGYLAASADFFPTVGTRVVRGRGFSGQDTATSEHVAVVNQTFVNKFLKGKQPIGSHFGPDPAMRNEFDIVGVVEDTKYGDPTTPVPPMFFWPITQKIAFTRPQDISVETVTHFASNLIVSYRGNSSAAEQAVRGALRSINPDIPVMQMETYEDQLGDNFTQEELVVRLTTLFGVLALLLASVGLYGVTAYTVARRTGEIGVRMALGASRLSVLTLVMRGAMTQAGVGLLLGIPLSLLAGHLLAHTLYETSAVQPEVLFAVIAILLGAAGVAALVPARHAAGVDPMQALRND